MYNSYIYLAEKEGHIVQPPKTIDEGIMETLEAIRTRRSVRKYTDQTVSSEQLNILLRAAMQAPSASNSQPWVYVVITEREILNSIPKFHPYSQMLLEAPIAVMVCADENEVKKPGRWMLDCSAATQNLLLAAHDQGLGGVWLMVYPDLQRMQQIRDLLQLPDHVFPVNLVSLGYPAEHPLPEDRFKPERIHYNRW
jgi:nitroreductase